MQYVKIGEGHSRSSYNTHYSHHVSPIIWHLNVYSLVPVSCRSGDRAHAPFRFSLSSNGVLLCGVQVTYEGTGQLVEVPTEGRDVTSQKYCNKRCCCAR